MFKDGINDISDKYKDELFRINCIEISSEIIDSKYEEYPILFVDNALKEGDKQKYIDYVFYGRNGMPVWKDYYAIKNLVETLKEIDGLDNMDAIDIITRIEESFLNNLYERLQQGKKDIVQSLKPLLFSILQKLEFFFPERKNLSRFLLRVNAGEVGNSDLKEAVDEYNTIFEDDHYFLVDEKLFIELCLDYFTPSKKKHFEASLDKLSSEKIKNKLPQHLTSVKFV